MFPRTYRPDTHASERRSTALGVRRRAADTEQRREPQRPLMGVAAGMGLAGGRARRAAVRGVLAVAGASALSNAVLKPVFPRRRPPAGTPEFTVRRGLPAPRSSSFPSGHSASAAPSPPPSRSNTPPPALRSHRSPRQSRTRACTPACTGRPTSRSVPVSGAQSPSLRGDGGQCGTRSPRRWDRIARRRRWSRATAWSCSSTRVRQRRRRRPYRGRAGAAQGSDRRVRR